MVEKIGGLVSSVLTALKPYVKDWKQLVMVIASIAFIALSFKHCDRYLEAKIANVTTNTVSAVTEHISEQDSDYEERIMDALEKHPEVDLAINSELDFINEELGSNRATVIQYHDGTKSPSGAPYLRYTMKYERILERVLKISSLKEQTRDIGIENLAYFLVKLKDSDYCYWDNVDDVKDGMILYSYKDLKIKSFINITLYNAKGQPCGLFTVYFYDDYHQFTNNDITFLMGRAQRISGFLDILYYENRQS